ncbi:MAG: hypothetical protein ACRDS9_28955, partial [Pseudonocardiaceae bacterium]
NSGFDAIRPWRGSTARGFEELCYQLFKSDAPPGTRAIRIGNPMAVSSGTPLSLTAPSGGGKPSMSTTLTRCSMA